MANTAYRYVKASTVINSKYHIYWLKHFGFVFYGRAHGMMVVWSIPHGGPIQLFLVPASAP